MKNGKSQTNECTSFSQLELSVSKAMGLLGALLPGPGGMPCSGGWLGHWLPFFVPRLVDRYWRTCCLWACWRWNLPGPSRWDGTWRRKIQRKVSSEVQFFSSKKMANYYSGQTHATAEVLKKQGEKSIAFTFQCMIFQFNVYFAHAMIQHVGVEGEKGTKKAQLWLSRHVNSWKLQTQIVQKSHSSFVLTSKGRNQSLKKLFNYMHKVINREAPDTLAPVIPTTVITVCKFILSYPW